MNADSRFSEEAFFQFIEFVGKKGLVKPTKANNWKSAGIQLLSILDSNEKSDLRNIEVDALVDRFANLKGTDVTASSLKTYRSRFKGAHSDFISWAEDPVNYSPSGRTHSAKPKASPSMEVLSTKKIKQNTNYPPNNELAEQASSIAGPTDSVVFPIPISGGRIITINNLPHELSKADAEKIGAVVKALAIPETKE